MRGEDNGVFSYKKKLHTSYAIFGVKSERKENKEGKGERKINGVEGVFCLTNDEGSQKTEDDQCSDMQLRPGTK